MCMCMDVGYESVCLCLCVCACALVCDEELECVVKAGKVVAALRGLFGSGSRCVFV